MKTHGKCGRLLAALLVLCMIVSMLPMAVFAEGETADTSGVSAAILHDTREATAGGIADDDLVKDYGVTVADGDDGVKVITLTGTDLRRHRNGDDPANMGYWAGVAIEAPEDAVKMKAVAKLAKGSLAEAFAAATARDLIANVNTAGKDGFVQYLDVKSDAYKNADGKFYIKLQWLGAEDAAIGEAVTYEVNFGGIKVAPPEIVAVGYREASAQAKTAIAADMTKAYGSAAGAGADADDRTMWITTKGFEGVTDGKYMYVVEGPDGRPLALHANAPAEKEGPGRTFHTGNAGCVTTWWTFRQDADPTTGTVISTPIKEGTYTFHVQAGGKDVCDPAPLTIGKVTVGDKTGYFDVAAGQKVADVVAVVEPTPEAGKVFTGWVINDTDKPIATETLNAKVLTETVTYKAKMEEVGPTEITVSAFNEDITGLNKAGSALQSNLDATLSEDGKTFTFAGESNYIFDWMEFDGRDEKNDGNFLAIKLAAKDPAVAESMTIKVGDATLDEDGIYVVILDGSKEYKDTVTVTVGEGSEAKTATYTLDFTGVTRKAPVVSSVAEAEGEIDASYRNGTVYLSGAVTFGDAATTADVPLNVTFEGPVTKAATAVITKGANDALTVADITLHGVTLTFDTTGLYIENPDSTAAPAVTAPTVSAPVFDDQAKADAAADVVAAMSGNTTVEERVLANVAAQLANNTTTAPEAALSATQKSELAAIDGAGTNLSKIQTAVADGTGDAFTAQGVNLVVNVYTEIVITDIVPAASGVPTTLTLSITPKAQTVLTTVSDETPIEVYKANEEEGTSNKATANAVLVKEEPAIIDTPTEVTIKLPASYEDGTYVIKHIKSAISHYFYNGSVSEQVLTFTSTHGFSDFVIYAENPCVAKIGDTMYETLQDAVNAVADNGTITILKALTGDDAQATVSGSSNKIINFALDDALSEVTLKINNTDVVVKKVATEDSNKFTYIYSGGSSNPGGSSGGSSNKPTTPTKPTNPTQFVDVPAGAYYTDAVKWAVEKGITTGMTDTTFAPNGDCTRAQMVTFLWRAAGSPKAEGENPFTDVAAGAYYYDAVLWAVSKGITNGTSAATFSPDATVSRAQTVTFLHRYAGAPEASGNSFTDVTAGSYYEGAVDWAVAEGVTQGTSDTTFSPDADCVRAQIVTFLYRYMVK